MKAFRTQVDFRRWLERHHDSESELMLRLFKVHAKSKGIGYREALDESLCFGWIDGVVRRLDEDSFVQRFTPRRARSNWSTVNVKRFRELQKAGKVHPAGLAAFQAWNGRKPSYAYEQPAQTLAPAFVKRLRAHRKAWAFWEALPPGYKRLMVYRVMSAKREETRESRFATLLAHMRRQERLPLVKPKKS